MGRLNVPGARDRWWRAGCATLAAALVLGSALACASDLAFSRGVYHHRRLGFSIAAPGADWAPLSLEGALLAFRRGDAASMSMLLRCRPTAAPPAVLARHLVIGTRDRVLRQAGPVLFEGRSGWAQVFDTRERDSVVRVKTVTLLTGDCVLDFLLAAPRGFDSAERAFDDWWSSLVLDAAQRAPAESAP